MSTLPRICGIAASALLALAVASARCEAKSIHVAANGANIAQCGTGANLPCETIAHAVSLAADGDSIVIGAGSHAGATIDKRVAIWSGAGQGAAVVTDTLVLTADGIVVGKLGKGLSFRAPATAVSASANNITIRGNFFNGGNIGVDAAGTGIAVRDNSFNSCSTCVRVNGTGASVRRNRFGFVGTTAILLGATSSAADVRENRMSGPGGNAVVIDGVNHLVRRNLVHGSGGPSITSTGSPTAVRLVDNLVVGASSPGYWLSGGSGWVLHRNAAISCNAPGFYIETGADDNLIGNVASGNTVYGFLIRAGSGQVIKDNTAVGNNSDGIVISSVGPSTPIFLSGGNVYGNANNCGLFNSSGTTVTADKVYWGAASGPGADPADTVCGDVANTVVTNPAAKPASIKLPPIK